MNNVYGQANYINIQKELHDKLTELRAYYGDSDELDQMHINNYLTHIKK